MISCFGPEPISADFFGCTYMSCNRQPSINRGEATGFTWGIRTVSFSWVIDNNTFSVEIRFCHQEEMGNRKICQSWGSLGPKYKWGFFKKKVLILHLIVPKKVKNNCWVCEEMSINSHYCTVTGFDSKKCSGSCIPFS